MKQALLDRVRVLNKHFTNKLMIRISGKNLGLFVILSHTGRKSGRLYRIPIIAERVEDGFVIALTYGKKVDWYANVKARGACWIQWKYQDYSLVNPVFLEKERGLSAFPSFIRTGLRMMGIEYFLKLDFQGN